MHSITHRSGFISRDVTHLLLRIVQVADRSLDVLPASARERLIHSVLEQADLQGERAAKAATEVPSSPLHPPRRSAATTCARPDYWRALERLTSLVHFECPLLAFMVRAYIHHSAVQERRPF